MRKGLKPSRGCAASGFTFVDAEGNLTQLSWDGLRSRGEALFLFDGVRWRRVRSTDQAPAGESVRFAVGPRDADAATLDRLSVVLPGGMLSGEFSEAVARARRLSELPRSLVEDSNLWSDLGPLDREVVMLLRNSQWEVSDAEIVSRLAFGRLAGSTLADVVGPGAEKWASRVQVPVEVWRGLRGEGLADVVVLAQAVALGDRNADEAANSLLGLVGRFLDADDPLSAALQSVYAVPAGPRWQVVNAVRLLQSLGVDPMQAHELAGFLGRDASRSEIDLLDWVLRRHPHDLEHARSVVESFRSDPTSTVREHGNVLIDFGVRFPELSSSMAQALIRSCGVHPFDPVSDGSARRLDVFDAETFDRLRQLIPDDDLFSTLAGPLLSTFGHRAPEWLMRSATSPEIDRARLLARLPDADTAVRRRRQLEESLAAPPLSDAERAAHVRRVELLGRLAAGESPADAFRDADPAVITALLPDAAVVRKRAKQLEIAGDDESLSWAALLRAFDAARVSGDAEAAEALAAEIVAAGDLAASLLPSGRQLDKEIERSEVAAAGAEDARRRESLEREYELWNAYATAFLDGDDEELLRVGALLRPDRDPTGGRVSVHDAAFWLPPSVDDASAPDGSRFGDWLLADDRGLSAIRSESGRRSLGSAALEWAANGGPGVQIKDLADRAATRNFGGHTDPVTVFFASNKVSPGSASETLAAVRGSVDVPTPFPLDTVFEDAASGLRGYFLPRTDPRGMQLGVLTDCCQHPAAAGKTCAFMGQEHPSGGFFVVENADGVVIAQSWVWAGSTEDGSHSAAVFDNVEARLSGESGARAAGVVSVYSLAAAALGERFDMVTVGAASDVPLTEFPLLPRDSTPSLATIGYHGYSDAHQHRLLHGGEPGLRFTGHADGFTVSDGVSSVFINRSGEVRCADGAGVELAQRALAGSTFREYEVIDPVSGQPTGARFTAGVAQGPGWTPDLAAPPASYSAVSEDLLETMRSVGVTNESEAEAFLRVAGYDPRRATRLAASGWRPEELEMLTEPYPALPEELRDPASPQLEATRTLFRQFAGTPLLAQLALQQGLSSGLTDDLYIATGVPPAALALLEACEDDALRGCVRAALIGSAAGTAAADEVRKAVVQQNLPSVNVRLYETVAAARDLAAAGLSAEDVGALHLFRSVSESGLSPALLDADERARWAALPAEERRLAVERVYRSSERRGGARPFSLAGWVGLPADLSQDAVDLLAAADPYDPRRALAVVEALSAQAQFPSASDDGSSRPAGGSASSDSLSSVTSPDGLGVGPGGLPLAAGEALRAYREKVRYVRGNLDELSAEDAVAVAGLDVSSLVEALCDLGLHRNYGDNMPEFTFTAESVTPLASMGADGVRRLGRSLSCATASVDDLATVASSGVDVQALSEVRPHGSPPGSGLGTLRAEVVGQALRSGVAASEVSALARSGASLELVSVALHAPACRQAVLSGSVDRETLERLADWACGGGRFVSGFSADLPAGEVDFLIGLVSSSESDREALLSALSDRERASEPEFRDVLESLSSASAHLSLVGGLRPRPEQFG